MKREEAPSDSLAEAAAWLARLHSDEVSDADIAGFQTWLGEDDAHRRALASVTEAWELAGGAAAGDELAEGRPAYNRRAVLALGIGAVAMASAGDVMWLSTGTAYATEKGEQRRFVLADGTSVMLDTDTRIEVRLGKRVRSVELVRGRASFRVANDPGRPFVVNAGDQQVKAVGTTFDVTQTGDAVGVLLLEGPVNVVPRDPVDSGQTIALAAGEHLVMRHNRIITRDHVDIDRATAWQKGRLVLDNTPLTEAAAEFNRYSRRPLVIGDARLGARRISGIYDLTDAQGFASSVSLLFAAKVENRPDSILVSLPAAPGAISHDRHEE